MGFLGGLAADGGFQYAQPSYVVPIRSTDPAGRYDIADAKEGAGKTNGQHVDVQSILAALQGLGAGQQPPPAPPPPQWLPPPPSRFLGDLQNVPQLGQRAGLMPPPQQMAPYLWSR